jgi:hypothetical protein
VVRLASVVGSKAPGASVVMWDDGRMYIGIGTVVLILIIVVIVMFLRR